MLDAFKESFRRAGEDKALERRAEGINEFLRTYLGFYYSWISSPGSVSHFPGRTLFDIAERYPDENTFVCSMAYLLEIIQVKKSVYNFQVSASSWSIEGLQAWRANLRLLRKHLFVDHPKAIELLDQVVREIDCKIAANLENKNIEV